MKITKILEPATDVLPRDESRPHVLIVVDGLSGPMGGGERIALKLASLLPGYGYRVSILTFQPPTDVGVRAHPPCPIYLLPLRNAFSLSGIAAAMQLGRFLRRHKISIVQTFFESSDLWAGLVTKLLSSAGLIWSRRDMGILRRRRHATAYRWLSRMPDRVFAVSELVRRHCIEVDGIDAARVQTIYNGIDLSRWSAEDRPGDRAGAVITTVGNIRHVKGHDLFLQAAATVVKEYPETRFSIAGATLDQAYLHTLEAMILQLGLEDRFCFAGGVTDLRTHFQGADLFVLPSRSEGFSNAIIEAMAMGLPVVATDVGGNAEAVKRGVSGLIVPPEDAPALANAMLQLLRDPEQARSMGGAGREIVSERFTVEAMMMQVTTAYGELLDRSPRRTRAKRLAAAMTQEKLSRG